MTSSAQVRAAKSEIGAVERRHVCPLCEAGCGLRIEVFPDGSVGRIRGDEADVASKGFVCPKGLELGRIDQDPNRLTQPVAREERGQFVPIAWDDALDRAADRLRSIQARHGRDAVAVYFGTVAVHKYDALLARQALYTALDTRNWTGVSALDTGARFVASRLLYGSCFAVPVPDIDRTQYLLCIGANPLVSNGSMMTAPDVRSRLRAIQERGGKIVVVDPRRSETASAADEHVPIRPGTDAALLLALLHCITRQAGFDARWFARHTRGHEELAAELGVFTPERVSGHTGVAADCIERLARELLSAERGVVYARMGAANNRYGTLCCALVDIVNMAAGRFGQVGGAMFSTPAIDVIGMSKMIGADGFDRYRTRVRGLPEVVGEIPAVCLAEEIEAPGPGQIRALLTFAGNPVLAVPNGRRLERALGKLEYHVAIDPFINESNRHADLILPPARLLADEHLDFFFANTAVRNVIRWSDSALPRADGELRDHEILLALAKRLGGGLLGIPVLDRLLHRCGIELAPRQVADWALRLGPHGDRFMPRGKGLSLERLRETPGGVDLGPLRPGFRHRVYHRGGKIALGSPLLIGAVKSLERELDASSSALLLIGRRELRSNNSWMHNLSRLMTGRERCVLLVHPRDAARLAIADGAFAELSSRVHSGKVKVRVSDEVCAGVVSLPHGYGHAEVARWRPVAGEHAGVSLNDWIDDAEVDPISGQAVLNGVAVTLRPCAPAFT